MKPLPQLDFTAELERGQTGNEVVSGWDLPQRTAELKAQHCVIESMETVFAHNASWRIHWRKKQQ